ncbi:hypothetical protein ABPG77_010139 [Micractinium sp. CCAP 211/92]
MPGQRLTAAQEARCGELAQAAKAAAAAALAVLERQQQQHHERAVEAAAFALAPSVAGGSVAAVDVEQAGPGISELRLVLRQGAAASLLLQRCNLGLVGLMQRRVARGRQLSPALCQDVTLAGMDALSRAAASYAPARDTRFSTYACAAIQNAMLDVLACCERGPGGSWQQPLVHVPPHARGLAASVQRATHRLQQQRSMTAAAEAAQQQIRARQGGEQALNAAAAEQQADGAAQDAPLQRRQPSEPAPPGLQQLSGAARLTARQTALGLAAARRQWVAGRDSQVPADSVEGGLARRPDRQTARFSDLQEEPCGGDAARAAVDQLLSRLPPKQRRLLLLRFGLEGAQPCGEALELDFASLGQVLGVSRQRVQIVYYAALRAAQREAAALGMARPRTGCAGSAADPT